MTRQEHLLFRGEATTESGSDEFTRVEDQEMAQANDTRFTLYCTRYTLESVLYSLVSVGSAVSVADVGSAADFG